MKYDVWTGPKGNVFSGALQYQLAIGLESAGINQKVFFRHLCSSCVVLCAGSDRVFSLYWH